MSNKVNIFLLQGAEGSIRDGLVDSLSYNQCNIKIFTTLEELLTSSSFDSPNLIILDQVKSVVDSRRTSIKIDQCFPHAEVVYLSKDMFNTSKNISQYKVEEGASYEKMSVAIDEMLYYITYHEHFDTDSLIINSSRSNTQKYFIPLAVGMLAMLLLGSLYFA